MKQYQAGYIVENLIAVFGNRSSKKKAFKELAKWASHFQIKSKNGFETKKVNYNASIAILINLIQRGLPTNLNKYAIDQIVEKSTLLSWDEEYNKSLILKFNSGVPDLKKLIFRSLHLIDPRIDNNNLRHQYQQSIERLGSNYEERFLFNDLPNALENSGAAFIQLIACQRTINNIIRESKDIRNVPNMVQNNFEEQKTDFSIEFPYYSERKGIVIEIDGGQHQTDEQMNLDTERDKAVAASGWNNTLRIKTSEFDTNDFRRKIINLLIPVINNNYIKNCILNYNSPLWDTDIGNEVLQICLIPFGVARIQRTLLEAIAHGILSLEKQSWKIAVIERDVPCASLAIKDLQKIIEVLNVLSNEPLIIPEIEFQVYTTNEFINSRFQDSKVSRVEDFDNTEPYDLVLDIAVLERMNYAGIIHANSTEIIRIRSIHYFDVKRVTLTADMVKYKPFCELINDSDFWQVEDIKISKSLEYLLQSIFRKKRFLEGQLPIMHNALQCKSVIGLLPTGGGKSLTYQLSALLQPGICLVIDPIGSLMKDQVDGLKRNNIDSCIYINTTLQGDKKRKAMKRLANGEFQFAFVSPERLQMGEFRDLLKDMHKSDLFFSYCVIDEVHCVSEWGHDFRTAYLRLGENAMKYCKCNGLEHIPLFGLTATASYDVLSDVQRELSGNDENNRISENSIIRSEYTKRDELQYVIEEVTFPTEGINSIWGLKEAIGKKKQDRVRRIISEAPYAIGNYISKPKKLFGKENWELNEKGEHQSFERIQIKNYAPNEFYTNYNAALIFCPHTRGWFGVTDKFKITTDTPGDRKGYYDILQDIDGIKAGYFMGSGKETNANSRIIQQESIENQDKFLSNELNLMVATKAFGMGIDKENIRYTIHINYPGSIESYVQEAGRAGRDGKIALSYILFNDQEVDLPNEDENIDHDLDINMYFHKNSFKGVEKELAVLDELLTEIYFPDRSFELEGILNHEYNLNVKCNYWEGGRHKRLYVNLGFNEPLGYLDLNTLNYYSVNAVEPNLSNQIFNFLIQYINNLNLTEPVYLWMQKADKKRGIEKILNSTKFGEKFQVTVGFYNDTNKRIETLTKWLKYIIHENFDEKTVLQMRANAFDANAFIKNICDKYKQFTRGNELYFEAVCKRRDIQNDNPYIGYAYKEFQKLYNGYRDKLDTEKAIYRLSILGIIDDYTVNFSSNTFTLIGKNKTDEVYKDEVYKSYLRNFLLKYYSGTTTSARMEGIDLIDEPTTIRKYLSFLINFVYKEIQKKRQFAIQDMKTACRIGLEKGNVELKEYIDLYFNSKYARSGYSFFDESGVEVNASLTDLTQNGKYDSLDWVWRFIEIVDEDPKAGQIDNIKHLRGACTRMLSNQPESYTLLLLNAFTLYMLEYKNPRYLQDAESLLVNAFTSIQEKKPGWSDEKLKTVFNKFTKKIKEKNSEIDFYMQEHGFAFDFDSITIKRFLHPLQNANRTIRSLNKILNQYGKSNNTTNQ
jgi:superfamily II DNA helicase RecQ